MRDATRLGLFLAGLLGCCQINQADPITFTITTFDVPGSTSTTAIGINNFSQIVGSYTDSTDKTHGFLDTNDMFTTLDFPGSTFTQATGINNVGQIVGFYSGGAFLYQNGTFSNLNIPAANNSNLFGIPQQIALNDSGQIVGTTSDGRGFLYANGQLTFLPTATYPATAAMDINNAGEIAGAVRTSLFIGGYASVYRNGQYTLLPGSDEAAAYGINDAGHILVRDFSGNNRSGPVYLIADGAVSSLPAIFPSATFPGFGRGLNDSDQIVGSLYNGHGFLATPVPEPAPILLFTGGLAGLAALIWRKRSRAAFTS